MEERTTRPGYAALGRLGDHGATLIEYDDGSAIVEHYCEIGEGTSLTFLLEWGAVRIAAPVRVAQTRHMPVTFGSSLMVYRSRIEFDLDGIGSAIESLLKERNQNSLECQMFNAFGTGAPSDRRVFRNGMITDSEIDGAGSGFVRLALRRGKWVSEWTADPNQPDEGFTVRANEAPDLIQQLCDAYEKADTIGRRLIRLQAAITLQPAV